MKSTQHFSEKRIYQSPKILSVVIDNQISLTLEATPPKGPNEVYLKMPEYINNDPYHVVSC